MGKTRRRSNSQRKASRARRYREYTSIDGKPIGPDHLDMLQTAVRSLQTALPLEATFFENQGSTNMGLRLAVNHLLQAPLIQHAHLEATNAVILAEWHLSDMDDERLLDDRGNYSFTVVQQHLRKHGCSLQRVSKTRDRSRARLEPFIRSRNLPAMLILVGGTAFGRLVSHALCWRHGQVLDSEMNAPMTLEQWVEHTDAKGWDVRVQAAYTLHANNIRTPVVPEARDIPSHLELIDGPGTPHQNC